MKERTSSFLDRSEALSIDSLTSVGATFSDDFPALSSTHSADDATASGFNRLCNSLFRIPIAFSSTSKDSFSNRSCLKLFWKFFLTIL